MSSNPRRAELKALCAGLSALKKEGAVETINEALVEIYKSQGYINIGNYILIYPIYK
jgi:hypothetical protein